MSDWRDYERLIARLEAEAASSDTTVIPNAKLIGGLSGVKRQIDVLLEYRYDSRISKRVIIDAKKHRRKIDVKAVEEFEGMMRDVNASHGIIVCPNGYSKAALKRAQDAIHIKLLPLSELESFDPTSWDTCLNDNCKEGLVLWDAFPSACPEDGPLHIHGTGKCDSCHRFHVWCWSCGNRFSLADEDDFQCDCKPLWYWLTAIEEEESGDLKSVYLLLIQASGTPIVIDRRPLK